MPLHAPDDDEGHHPPCAGARRARAGLTLGACGKGGYTVTVGTSPPGGSSAAHARGKSAPATPRGGRAERERRARALAYAHAVNIGAADVPGFQVAPKQERETPAAERRLEQ